MAWVHDLKYQDDPTVNASVVILDLTELLELRVTAPNSAYTIYVSYNDFEIYNAGTRNMKWHGTTLSPAKGDIYVVD